MMDPRWKTLLDETRKLHALVPALNAFRPFPDPVTPQQVVPHHDPLADRMAAEKAATIPSLEAFRAACIAASPAAKWRETYKDTPGGEAIHAFFATYEILGRDTALGTHEMRSFIVYQAPGAHYPLHHHPAEELYLVIAGEADFTIEGEGTQTLRPGDTSYHRSNVPHALTTGDQGIIAYVLWRGDLLTKPVFTYPEDIH